MGRKFGVGNLAFPFGRQISHASSGGFLPCPPNPLCFAFLMSHSLLLASDNFPITNFTTAKLTRHPPPPVCDVACTTIQHRVVQQCVVCCLDSPIYGWTTVLWSAVSSALLWGACRHAPMCHASLCHVLFQAALLM